MDFDVLLVRPAARAVPPEEVQVLEDLLVWNETVR